MKKLTFSGHETFPCKTLWLKKGADFINNNNDFNALDSVTKLGVGKNMVSSIRYWLKAFGLTIDDELTPLATNLFSEDGWDPFCEDIATLWLLHYMLVKSSIANLYNITFCNFNRSKHEFSQNDLVKYVKDVCDNYNQTKTFNEKTVYKDVNVLLQNYTYPENAKNPEDFSNLLIGLRLVREKGKVKTSIGKMEIIYQFEGKKYSDMVLDIIYFALADIKEDDIVLSYDKLSDIALIFGLSINELKIILRDLEKKYKGEVSYSDNSGIVNFHFLKNIDKLNILNNYYNKH